MADPVTMAVVGSMAGAAMSPKDPLKGALLGAVGGYGGGAMLGAAGTAASTAATTGLSTAGGTLAPALGSSVGAGGATIGGATGLSAPAFTGFGLTPAATGTAAGQAALQAPAAFQGVGLTSANAPTFMQTMKQVPGSMMDYIKANPMESAKFGQSLLGDEQPPMQATPPNIMRGQQMAQQPQQYNPFAAPNISLI